VRLLAVSPLAGLAGGETSLLRLLIELRERGWQVRLAVPGRGPLRDTARAASLPVVRLPLGRPERAGPAALAGAALAPLAARGAEVVLLNGLPAQRLVPVLAPLGRPLVVRVNNPLPAAPRAWRRRGFWRAVRALVADSRHTATECAAAGAPAARVHVAYPAAWSGATPPPAADPGGGAAPRVGFCGSIEPRKGVAELVEAAATFLVRDPAATLTLIGTPPPGARGYAALVRRAVAATGLAGRIELAGFRADAAAELAGFDVVCVPSLAEPFGTVAAEAAAVGVPVVASAVGGLVEVVADGETGVLVPPGDRGALADAVAGLLADPERRRRLGATARERALLRFSPAAYADAVEPALRAALGR